MDGTQTSEPTETGPGSPGQASAFRRALDEQAISEGPLDLTVPLNIAEVRAALSTSGSIPVVRDIAKGVSSLPPRSHGARRPSRHASTKRLGRIAVFVALAAAMSVGTACALVLSSGSQTSSSVSLPPTTGNIPVAPSEGSSQQGQISVTSGSTSATATPSLTHSASATASTASPSASLGASGSASPSTSADGSASPGQSPSAGASVTASVGAPPVGSSSPTWVTLYWGIQNEQPEVSQVQTLLTNIGYLDNWRRRGYLNPQVNVQPDQSGSYGSATEDAIVEFQQSYNVDYTGEAGTCDLATYDALVQVAG